MRAPPGPPPWGIFIPPSQIFLDKHKIPYYDKFIQNHLHNILYFTPI